MYYLKSFSEQIKDKTSSIIKWQLLKKQVGNILNSKNQEFSQ